MLTYVNISYIIRKRLKVDVEEIVQWKEQTRSLLLCVQSVIVVLVGV